MTQGYEKLAELRPRLLEILDEAMQVDGAACGKIRVVDPESGALEIQAQRGFSNRFVESFAVLAPEDPAPSARAARMGQRVTMPDLSRQPGPAPYVAAAREEGVKAMQVTPIIGSGGKVVGTLSTHFAKTYRPSASAAMVLDYCARKAASLIESVLGSPGQPSRG